MSKQDDGPHWEKLHPWFKQAHDIALAKGGFVKVERGSPEFKAWREYFKRELQWMPWFMRDGLIKDVTLPSRWPPSSQAAVAKLLGAN